MNSTLSIFVYLLSTDYSVNHILRSFHINILTKNIFIFVGARHMQALRHTHYTSFCSIANSSGFFGNISVVLLLEYCMVWWGWFMNCGSCYHQLDTVPVYFIKAAQSSLLHTWEWAQSCLLWSGWRMDFHWGRNPFRHVH